ncbi:MAG: deoxyribodipyrimidine photo-lyase [Labilithrix sp.]|nr:deoxyribodipyrimidine photo-lyase [Labilithrix sp.]
MRTLVWFRGKDLRVADHTPLIDAAKAGEVVPLFVVDPYFFAPARARELPHRMQFLLASIEALGESIEALGSRLLVVSGKSVEIVPRVARALKVDRVVAHRWSEPFGVERDRRVTLALGEVPFVLYEGETLAAPGEILTGAGQPFSVFTPFARAFAKTVTIDRPKRAPRSLPPLPRVLPAEVRALEDRVPSLRALGLEHNPRLVPGGERAARERLSRFLRGPASRYHELRDRLDLRGTSRLSQDLKFGTLSARAVWHAAKDALEDHPKAWRSFSNELVWRELAYDVLRSRPHVLERPFRSEWARFPWRRDEKGWRAWADGTTGYPVVDAAARQLLAEGFVPNRARMIAASFLCKHLLVDFRRGEAHYMKFLTDGDWANNDLGWQWSAGCGVDAQPWFRVFNPITQGERFDPEGAWVRAWVPELAKLPARLIHRPWEAPAAELAKAGVALGRTYPRPVVDHALGRGRFLGTAQGFLRS